MFTVWSVAEAGNSIHSTYIMVDGECDIPGDTSTELNLMLFRSEAGGDWLNHFNKPMSALRPDADLQHRLWPLELECSQALCCAYIFHGLPSP